MGPGRQCRGSATRDDKQHPGHYFIIICLCPALALSATTHTATRVKAAGWRCPLLFLALLFCTPPPSSSSSSLPPFLFLFQYSFLLLLHLLKFRGRHGSWHWGTCLYHLFSLLLTKTWTYPHFPFVSIITTPMYVSPLHFPSGNLIQISRSSRVLASPSFPFHSHPR